MPRSFNPEDSDPNIIFINKVRQIFARQTSRFSEEEITAFVRRFLKDEKYVELRRGFRNAGATFPQILLRNNCVLGHYFMNPKAYLNV